MSTGSAADGEASARGRAARPVRRVVVSSVTGKPIDWEVKDASAPAASRGEEPKVLPDRLAEDAPEPGRGVRHSPLRPVPGPGARLRRLAA